MADVTTTVRAVVSVVDKATAPLRAISSQFRAFGAGLGGSARTLKELGNAAPVYRLGAALHGVSDASKKVWSNIKSIATPLMALGGVAALGGLAESMHHFAEQGEQLHKTSVATGDTVEHLQQLDHWADTSGVSVDALHSAMGRANKAIGAAEHGNKAAIQTFKGLKIAFDDGHHHGRTFGDMAGDLVNRFSRMRTASERAYWGQRLFGKGWQEVIPLLAQGSAKYKEATEEARKHGMLTEQNVRDAKALEDAQKNLSAAIRGTVNAIAARLAPILTPLIKQWTAWVDENRAWLADEVVRKIGQVGDALKTLRDLVGGTTNLIKTFGLVVGAIVLAPFGKALWGIAAAFDGIVVAIVGGLAKLDVAALVNPWMLALYALIAVGVLVYRNWDTIKARASAAITWIQQALGPLTDALSAAWELAKPALAGLLKLVDLFIERLVGIPNVATGAFQGVADAWDALKAHFTDTPLALPAGTTETTTTTGRTAGGGVPWRPAPQARAPYPGAPRRGLAAAGVPGAGPTPASGTVDVNVNLPNPPPGTRATTTTKGKGLRATANVGQSMPHLAMPAALGGAGAGY